jgi:hypothetical protein
MNHLFNVTKRFGHYHSCIPLSVTQFGVISKLIQDNFMNGKYYSAKKLIDDYENNFDEIPNDIKRDLDLFKCHYISEIDTNNREIKSE